MHQPIAKTSIVVLKKIPRGQKHYFVKVFAMPTDDLRNIEANLNNWKNSLFKSIPLAGLLSRNPTVYKWKAPWRSLMLREALFWRQHDLMSQTYLLYHLQHLLGARILLRSGFETLATLIYLNQLTRQVLANELSFSDWGEKTSTLLLGSRNNEVMPKSINIVTVLEKCDKLYPGLMKLYASLSVSAHPNYEGISVGYSKTDYDEYETTFSNRWMELYGEKHLTLVNLCMETFHEEYDVVWSELIEKLENWIEANDLSLEASKTKKD
jgi:hypothetical protein